MYVVVIPDRNIPLFTSFGTNGCVLALCCRQNCCGFAHTIEK